MQYEVEVMQSLGTSNEWFSLFCLIRYIKLNYFEMSSAAKADKYIFTILGQPNGTALKLR